jgi:Lar family restriction alleviation protein
MKLKPCPFCGSIYVNVIVTQSGLAGLSGAYIAFCAGCFAQSAEFDTVPEAEKAWNRRYVKPKGKA